YAATTRPSEVTAFLNLGNLFTYYVRDYARAEKNYRAAIRIKPNEPMAYIELANLYAFFYKQKAELAKSVLKEGISANLQETNILKALADVEERAGNYAGAIAAWENVLEKDPGNAFAKDKIAALKQQLQP
ncbi:MAG: tetratricopeptide repeat protein, partial [Candidatus Sungbacteria bacterium]|nr:tetratricopeptide repeat protein [Candidatus Sungbacteria bacterium]